MKRCPQCEFIYEDEQNLCDMDGNQLVSDAPSFRVEQDAAALPTTPKRKSGLRLFAVLAIPAVALGVLLPMAFHGSGQPPVSQNSNRSEPAQSVPTPQVVVPAASPSPSPEEMPSASASEENEHQRSIAKASAEAVARANSRAIGSARAQEVSSDRSRASATQPVVARNRVETKPPATAKATPTDNKDDSKLGGFLKKTGRILKKPFKF